MSDTPPKRATGPAIVPADVQLTPEQIARVIDAKARRDAAQAELDAWATPAGDLASNTVVLSFGVTSPVRPFHTPPRLTVDLARSTVTLDGTSHDVRSESALRWLAVLAAHPGLWISGRHLEDHDEELAGVRTDRLRRYLPEQILALIESDTGRGSRLRA